jgi:hypothetical protein
LAFLKGLFMADMDSLLKNIGSIAIPAMRTFAMTFVLMLLLGIILCVPSFAIASAGGVGWGALAAFLAIAITGGLGFVMSQKRAIATGLIIAVEKYQAGSQAVLTIFSKIPGIEKAQGAASLLPVAQAEKFFTDAIAAMLVAPPDGGGIQGSIKRRVQSSLLEKVTEVTMPQFRAAQGGVDLIKVRDAAAEKADITIKTKLYGVKNSANIFIVFAIVASLAVAFLVRYLSTRP